MKPISFAVANYGTDEILKNNFLASPCLRAPHDHQILIQQDFVSAALAYNDAIDRAKNDLVIFAHHDLILPEAWLCHLSQALEAIELIDPAWGVLGCWGVTREGEFRGHIYSSGLGILGRPFSHPERVQTLDEIILIFRKSSGLRFDASLPNFHMYGSDLCLRAATKGMASYVIPAFCIHNTNRYLVLPDEFYESCLYVRRVWKKALPIQTSCTRITKFNIPLFRKRFTSRLRKMYQKELVIPRESNTRRLLARVSQGT
jgi:hypothetical protein